MSVARKRRRIAHVAWTFSLSLTFALAGCDNLNKLLDGNSSSPEPASSSAKSVIASNKDGELPADLPKDIRILDGAKAISAIKTGDGVTKGGGFYQLSFRVAASLEETAKQYRQFLKESGFEYVDEPVADSVSISGNTPAWTFYLTISKSSEVKGETAVTISYSK